MNARELARREPPTPFDNAMTRLLLSLAVVAILAIAVAAPGYAQERSARAFDHSTGIASDEVRTGRYSTVTTQPTPAVRAPLQVVAVINFPRSHVNSVGDAIQYLLIRTGYRLDHAQLSERARAVLTLPLPDNQRRVGPYRVEQILDILLGDPWVLAIDTETRTVRYGLAAAAGSAAAPAPAEAPSAPAATSAAPSTQPANGA